MSLKVFAASIVHESNTFNIVPTTLYDFQKNEYLEGAAAIDGAMRGTRSEWGAV
ncbi:MAG: M81 family metallopeptidase, partial [Mesorhizobium sp.]